MSREIDGNKDYLHLLGAIKERIRTARVRAALKVNHELLSLYWFIGQALYEKEAEWGSKFIESLSRDLKVEFPDSKGFSKRNLEEMRRWYGFWSSQPEIAQQLVAQLHTAPEINIAQQAVAQFTQQPVDPTLATLLFNVPWGHHTHILAKTKAAEEACFYLVKTIQNNWSRSILQAQMESRLYDRQGRALNNFELTLPNAEADLARETLKSPYNFDFLTLAEDAQEREVERGLIGHIRKFLLELGKGFAYVGNQYNLNVAGDDFFLDLLFFNINLNRYVIFELKVGDFKPEYAGKLNMYVNTVNEQLRLPRHEDTIGVLLCKTPNRAVIELSVKGVNAPMGVAEYKLTRELQGGMPTRKQLEAELKKDVEPKPATDPVDEQLARIRELIAKSGKPTVQTSKNRQTVTRIIDSSFVSLLARISKLLAEKEVNHLFDRVGDSYANSQGNFEEFGTFRQALVDTWTDYANWELYLGGFKQMGVDAFNINITVGMDFHQYAYNTRFGRSPGTLLLRKLYHEELTPEEINDLAETVVMKLLFDIENQVKKVLEG